MANVRDKEEFVARKMTPIEYDNQGNKIIRCEKCGQYIKCVGTTDNFYSSHDLYICDTCNVGYKAKIFTGLGGNHYIGIEPALIDDINIIVNSGKIMEKYRKQTREELAKLQIKRGRPRKNATK